MRNAGTETFLGMHHRISPHCGKKTVLTSFMARILVLFSRGNRVRWAAAERTRQNHAKFVKMCHFISNRQCFVDLVTDRGRVSQSCSASSVSVH